MICAQVVHALAHCHACGIAHCNVCPSNILVDHASVDYCFGLLIRLSNFGDAVPLLSRIEATTADDDKPVVSPLLEYSHSTSHGSSRFVRGEIGPCTCNALGYIAPEVVLESRRDDLQQKIDVWSVGCIALELALGLLWFKRTWALPFEVCQRTWHHNLTASQNLGRKEALVDAISINQGTVQYLFDHFRSKQETHSGSSDEACVALSTFVGDALKLDPTQRPEMTELANFAWLADSTAVLHGGLETSDPVAEADACSIGSSDSSLKGNQRHEDNQNEAPCSKLRFDNSVEEPTQ